MTPGQRPSASRTTSRVRPDWEAPGLIWRIQCGGFMDWWVCQNILKGQGCRTFQFRFHIQPDFMSSGLNQSNAVRIIFDLKFSLWGADDKWWKRWFDKSRPKTAPMFSSMQVFYLSSRRRLRSGRSVGLKKVWFQFGGPILVHAPYVWHPWVTLWMLTQWNGIKSQEGSGVGVSENPESAARVWSQLDTHEPDVV